MELNKIYVGNNFDILKTFPDNSIDSIVTDPPYGLGKEPNAIEVLQSWITTGYHEIKGKGFMGKKWDSFVPQPLFWKECYRVLKHGGNLLSFAGTRTYDWVVMGLRIAGFEIRDQIAWVYGSGFPKSHDISKAIDKMMGAEREVVGKHQQPAKSIYTQSKVEMNKDVNITAPSTEEAKQWQGWGTALKPALEPIVIARKPLDGTVAQNVLKYGVGGINIDGCRVETEDIMTPRNNKVGQNGVFNASGGYVEPSKFGRFPANFIHDGSEEVVKLFPREAGGFYRPNVIDKSYKNNQNINYGGGNVSSQYNDSGSAARFFYTAKASQTERNWGVDSKNIHPTVKPIDLMRYLVRLVTPKNGICLDPYMGSGTTAIACKAEKINYVGCELDQDYVEIAEARIKAEVVMYDIYDFMEETHEK